jgi:hypothetical protein
MEGNPVMKTLNLSVLTATATILAVAVGSPTARADGALVTKPLIAAAGAEICTATPQDPHRSSGNKDGRILFKTRVTCRGTYPAVTVYIHGSLEEGPLVGPKRIMTTSDQTQVVKTGDSVTFYTPEKSGKQVRTAGTYTGYITGEITAPVPGKIGTGNSRTVHVK